MSCVLLLLMLPVVASAQSEAPTKTDTATMKVGLTLVAPSTEAAPTTTSTAPTPEQAPASPATPAPTEPEQTPPVEQSDELEEETPVPSVSHMELLEKAKRENAARVSMRRAALTPTECLATAMYHEARGEGEKGMKAVAYVIYNRVKSGLFPKDYCQVVLQRSQFSFTSDRNPDNIRDWVIYAKVLAMAVELIQNDGFQRMASPVGSALFFNSFRSRNGWSYAKARKFVATIGNHHFFK